MLSATDKNTLYSKVTNKKYSTSREYLSSTYGIPRVLYYNADTKQQKQEKKRLKARYIALIFAALSAAIGIVTVVSSKSKNKNMSDFANKAANCMSNFNNAKDDYWNKASKKLSEAKIMNHHPFAFIEKAGEKITDFYKKTVKKSFAPAWDDKADNIRKLADKEGIKLNIEKFDSWYNSLYDKIYKNLHKENERITDDLINKKILSKFSKSNIADEKIHNIANGALSDKIKIPENASEELVQEINSFNKYKYKTAATIIPKLRDISLGSGPTDVLNQIITMLSLLTVIKTSGTKEEKQSIIINLGIPILTAIGATTVATLRALSGATALAFGLITGQAASIGANLLSKGINKHKKQKT